jgi:hypothetical protein
VAIWRLRQCPRCEIILPAGEFPPTELGPGAWQATARWGRECPECGYLGPTADFVEVWRAPRRAAADRPFPRVRLGYPLPADEGAP